MGAAVAIPIPGPTASATAIPTATSVFRITLRISSTFWLMLTQQAGAADRDLSRGFGFEKPRIHRGTNGGSCSSGISCMGAALAIPTLGPTAGATAIPTIMGVFRAILLVRVGDPVIPTGRCSVNSQFWSVADRLAGGCGLRGTTTRPGRKHSAVRVWLIPDSAA
jgi:hypothetical protein